MNQIPTGEYCTTCPLMHILPWFPVCLLYGETMKNGRLPQCIKDNPRIVAEGKEE